MLETKIQNFKETGVVHHLVYDNIFFQMIRNMLGGRIRWIVSGGAPLQGDVQLFISACFSAHIFNAFGMTELAGCVTVTSIYDK